MYIFVFSSDNAFLQLASIHSVETCTKTTKGAGALRKEAGIFILVSSERWLICRFQK